MTTPTVFTQLCDLVDELQRVVRDLPYSPQHLALEALVHRFDLLIDQTVVVTPTPRPPTPIMPALSRAEGVTKRGAGHAGQARVAYARGRSETMPRKEPPPGQLAYTAYTAALPLTFPRPWEGVAPQMQAAWEAAAEAVRAHRTMDTHGCPVCGARDLASRPPGLTEGGEVHRDMTCEDCGATWVNVYTFAETRYVQTKEEDDHA